MKQIFAIGFLLFVLSGHAQPGVIRIELDAALNSDIYKLVPCGEKGVLVFYETKDFAGEGSKNWFFRFLDRNLQERWQTLIPVINGADYQQYIFSDSLIYLAFLNTGRTRAGTENFQALIIDLVNGISYETKASLPGESSLKKMVVHQNTAYLGLNLKSEQAAIYTVTLRTGEVNPFNIVIPDQNFIEDLAYDPHNKQLIGVFSNFLSRRQYKMYMVSLTPEGNYQYDEEIRAVLDGKYLNTARIYPLEGSKFMMIGAYGSLSAKIPTGTEYFGIESAGVFVTMLENRKQSFMNYFNFMEFTNLRAGVSARDFYRLQRRKPKETSEYSLNYELLMHDAELYDSNYVIMMEAFYPEFRTVSDIAYDYWGRPVTNTYTVFDGYRFFNAILAAFNTDGELLWDNSLEMNLVPISRKLTRASYFFDGKPVVLFYNDGLRIYYRVCFESGELEPFSRMDLATLELGDRITATGLNQLYHWYDQYFLAYGYHTIQNNRIAGRSQRTVFYINKISLE
ncbi:MAG: hypothetical protein K0B08_06095 [Bacteroidales bacterium]|nr:hypothetical protein [Bacteroidales bacterium]